MKTPKLNPEELAVLMDKQFMPLKFSASNKVITLLNDLKKGIERVSEPFIPTHLPQSCMNSAKISKGENYKTFAYRVLDFPRIYEGDDLFFYRTLMLWGHHFSFNLLLTGKWKKNSIPNLLCAFEQLKASDFLLSTQESPWDCEIGNTSHLPIREMDLAKFEELLNRRKFIKLTLPHKLSAYESLPEQGARSWTFLMNCLFMS